MTDTIVIINAGSSSIKAAIYTVGPDGLDPTPRLCAHYAGIGGHCSLEIINADGEKAFIETNADSENDHDTAFSALFEAVDVGLGDGRVIGVGHRVVHGGVKFSDAIVLDAAQEETLSSLSMLAPGHQPFNLDGVRRARQHWPEAAQIACFDTAFHRTQPKVAQRFALPVEYETAGVIRYGFHGLSYEYIAANASSLMPGADVGRMIVAHLGAGASMCAIKDGRSIATTMGFTALDGLPMATRCGDIDPGVLLHLLGTKVLSLQNLNDVLYKRSGLLGLSGLSGDMRVLENSDTDHARDAIDYFVYHAARAVGALTAALGGLDCLVFTAGIGENSSRIRSGILSKLDWLGFVCDDAANEIVVGPTKISKGDTGPTAWVTPTNEELMIAQHTVHLVTR